MIKNPKPIVSLAFLFLVFPTFCLSQDRKQEGPYPVDKTSVRFDGVPQGKLIKRKFSNSKIFPGTERVETEFYSQTPLLPRLGEAGSAANG